MRYVMVGNSYAAFGAIEAIRPLDRDGPITVISDEPYPCYARPLITFWLGGSVTTERMYYRPAGYYEAQRITTKLGRRAVSIDLPSKHVVLADGERVPYDKLLIATGGKPFIPPIDGLTPAVKNVHTFTRWDDAKALARLSRTAAKAVVIGGGLIGVKAAEALNNIRVDTTIVGRGPRMLRQALDEHAGRLAGKRLNDHGVKTITGLTAREILVNAGGEVAGVVLADGSRLECGILVLAIGMRPDVDLVKGSAVAVERGIVTDERMQTSVTDVYAAGDVTQNRNLLSGKQEVIAIVPVAYEQGRVAGRNMAGRPMEYRGEIPMNSVEIYGLPIMSMGATSKANDRQREESFHDGEVYRKLVFEDDRLVGALLTGNVDHGGVLTHLIRSRRRISPAMMRWLEAGDTLALSALIISEGSRSVGAARGGPGPAAGGGRPGATHGRATPTGRPTAVELLNARDTDPVAEAEALVRRHALALGVPVSFRSRETSPRGPATLRLNDTSLELGELFATGGLDASELVRHGLARVSGLRTILFVCSGNAIRSQMAEAIVNHFWASGWAAFSAGVLPVGVHPEAIEVMREMGIDLAGRHAKHVALFERCSFDRVVALCSEAEPPCAALRSAAKVERLHFDDPLSPDVMAGAIYLNTRSQLRSLRERMKTTLFAYLAGAA